MDIGPGADATLLERALEGEPVDDSRIVALVAVADAVRSVDQSGLAPRAEFVSSLRTLLLDEQHEIAVGGAAGSTRDPAADRPEPARATVLHLPQRPLKLLAGIAASIVLIAALLGVASRSAVPGDALYPIKQLLDRAAVALSGSRLDEGRTHLAQAQQHISEARDLLDRGEVDPQDLDIALTGAADSVVAADRVLTDVYADEGRPEALTELADFLTHARLQVDAMDARIPDASRPAYERLRDVLRGAEVEALRKVAACGPCGEAAVRARQALAVLGSATATEAAAPGDLNLPALPLPTATVAVPSVGVTTDGAVVDGGGVTLPGATLELPSAGVTTTGIVIGGGGVTLPSATVPLPTLSVPLTTAAPSTSATLLPTLPGLSPTSLLAPPADAAPTLP